MSDFSTVEVPPVAGGTPLPPEPPPQRRRALWIALIAGLAALLVAVPLVLVLALRGDSRPSGSPNAGPSAAPSPTATVPSPAPSTGPATHATPAPDGRIPVAQLRNATLNIPAWPADNLTGLSGPVKFTNGEAITPPDATFRFERHVTISGVRYGDVDRDGAQETVVLIGCWVQGGSEQVVVFDRDRQGRIVTLGTVVATTGPIRTIDILDAGSFSVRSDGQITVRVADFQGCCGDQTPVIWQTRAYGWTGRGFRQTGGPAAFPVNPHVTETALSVGTLVFGPAAGGTRHGTLSVTVTYLYGAKPAHLTLVFWLPPDVAREGTSWPRTHSYQYGTFAVDLPTPAKGVAATYIFAFGRTSSGADDGFGVHLVGANGKNVGLSESNLWNNSPRMTVRVAN